MKVLTSLFLLLHLTLVTPQLIITSRDGKRSALLRSNSQLCPPTLSKSGIAIRCKSPSSKAVNFFLDGNFVSWTSKAPFYMFDDSRGRPVVWRNWRSFMGRRTIACVTDNGKRHVARVLIACSRAPIDFIPRLSPEPMTTEAGTLSLFNFSEPEGRMTIIEDGKFICRQVVRSMGIRCQASGSTTFVKFFVDGRLVATPRRPPFYISGKKIAFKRGPFVVVGCELSDGTKNELRLRLDCEEDASPTNEAIATIEPEMEPSATNEALGPTVQENDEYLDMYEDEMNEGDSLKSETGCVVIDARSTQPSPGWSVTETGITFLGNDTSDFRAPPGLFTVSYFFQVPVTSTYAVVIDLTSKKTRRHNDVWTRFEPSGFVLMRGGVVQPVPAGVGWTLVTKKHSGRGLVGTSGSPKSYTLSTRRVLETGKRNKLELSGRSSNVEIHRLLLFPCKDESCQRGSPTWKRRLSHCAALHR